METEAVVVELVNDIIELEVGDVKCLKNKIDNTKV